MIAQPNDKAQAPIHASHNPMSVPRDFKGLWIPREIYLHPDLSPLEKMLWAEIHSLYDRKRGGCYASNAYLSAFLRVTERYVREMISHLKSLGLIREVSFDCSQRVLAAIVPQEDFENPEVMNNGSGGRNHSSGGGGTTVPGGRNHSSAPLYIESKDKKKQQQHPKREVAQDVVVVSSSPQELYPNPATQNREKLARFGLTGKLLDRYSQLPSEDIDAAIAAYLEWEEKQIAQHKPIACRSAALRKALDERWKPNPKPKSSEEIATDAKMKDEAKIKENFEKANACLAETEKFFNEKWCFKVWKNRVEIMFHKGKNYLVIDCISYLEDKFEEKLMYFIKTQKTKLLGEMA